MKCRNLFPVGIILHRSPKGIRVLLSSRIIDAIKQIILPQH